MHSCAGDAQRGHINLYNLEEAMRKLRVTSTAVLSCPCKEWTEGLCSQISIGSQLNIRALAAGEGGGGDSLTPLRGLCAVALSPSWAVLDTAERNVPVEALVLLYARVEAPVAAHHFFRHGAKHDECGEQYDPHLQILKVGTVRR
jgi:hypothetical protein